MYKHLSEFVQRFRERAGRDPGLCPPNSGVRAARAAMKAEIRRRREAKKSLLRKQKRLFRLRQKKVIRDGRNMPAVVKSVAGSAIKCLLRGERFGEWAVLQGARLTVKAGDMLIVKVVDRRDQTSWNAKFVSMAGSQDAPLPEGFVTSATVMHVGAGYAHLRIGADEFAVINLKTTKYARVIFAYSRLQRLTAGAELIVTICGWSPKWACSFAVPSNLVRPAAKVSGSVVLTIPDALDDRRLGRKVYAETSDKHLIRIMNVDPARALDVGANIAINNVSPARGGGFFGSVTKPDVELAICSSRENPNCDLVPENAELKSESRDESSPR